MTDILFFVEQFDINYWLVLLGVVISIIIGSVWFSPLMFGKLWMKINGVEHKSKEELKAMQKEMGSAYILQALLSAMHVLTMFMLIEIFYPFGFSWWYAVVFIWVGFVIPIQAGDLLWGNTPKGLRVKKFLVNATYQLVSMLIIGFAYVQLY